MKTVNVKDLKKVEEINLEDSYVIFPLGYSLEYNREELKEKELSSTRNSGFYKSVDFLEIVEEDGDETLFVVVQFNEKGIEYYNSNNELKDFIKENFRKL